MKKDILFKKNNANKAIPILVFCILIGILLSGIGRAAPECGDEVQTNTACSIVTPHISYCGSYIVNITYLSNESAFISEHAMSQIGTSGIYNYTATFPFADTYVVKSCDDSVRTITAVAEDNFTSVRKDISYLNSNITEIQNRIGDPTTNSTTLWDWVYIPVSHSCDDADFPGISRLWCFFWRTIHAISP